MLNYALNVTKNYFWNWSSTRGNELWHNILQIIGSRGWIILTIFQKNHRVSTFSTHDIQNAFASLNLVDCGKVWEVTVQSKLKFPPPLLPFHSMYYSIPSLLLLLRPPIVSKYDVVFLFGSICLWRLYIHEIETCNEIIWILLFEYACGTQRWANTVFLTEYEYE